MSSDVALSWIKCKLRPLFFKAWEWSLGHGDDDEGLVYYDSYGNRRVCPGVGCNDGSCPGWG